MVDHSTGVRKGTIKDQARDTLRDHGTSPLFLDFERLLLDYARDDGNGAGGPGLVEALKRHLSAEARTQLTLSIAAANVTDRFNQALGTELEA